MDQSRLAQVGAAEEYEVTAGPQSPQSCKAQGDGQQGGRAHLTSGSAAPAHSDNRLPAFFGTSNTQQQGTAQDNNSGHTSAFERAARLISEASSHDAAIVSLIHARVSRAKLDLECNVPKP